MSWPAARRPPMREYLLAEAQPATRMPITEIDESPRARKMPVSRFVKLASGPNGITTTMRNVDASTMYGAILNSQIGRESCRERVCQYVSIWVVVRSLKKHSQKK